MKKIIKSKSITWFQISELCPSVNIFTKIYPILRYMGNTRDKAKAWAGRLKNGEGVFIKIYKKKIVIQNIAYW